MAVQIQGSGGTVADVGGTTFRGFKIQAVPLDHGALGHYRVAVSTGTMAAALAASAQIFQFKWTDATRLAIPTYVQVQAQALTKFTAATLTDYGSVDMFVVRSYALGGGGTTLTLTADNNQMRTSMGASLATINVSTTAALTAATTLDAQPIAAWTMTLPTVTSSATAEQGDARGGILYNPSIGDGEHPLVLAQNEGFVIRNRTVWPAAGTAVYTFTVRWAEVAAF